jgi:hypothetical protein
MALVRLKFSANAPIVASEMTYPPMLGSTSPMLSNGCSAAIPKVSDE